MTERADEYALAGCVGKARFESYAAADRIQKRRGRDRKYRKSEVYRCRVCRGWHLGRSDAERSKQDWRRYLRQHEERWVD